MPTHAGVYVNTLYYAFRPPHEHAFAAEVAGAWPSWRTQRNGARFAGLTRSSGATWAFERPWRLSDLGGLQRNGSPAQRAPFLCPVPLQGFSYTATLRPLRVFMRRTRRSPGLAGLE